MTHTSVSVIHEDDGGELKWNRSRSFLAGVGDVSVVEKVVGFKKIKFFTHENVGYGEVHLPEMQMHTTAFWLTVPENVMKAVCAPRPAIVDALRGLSHAMHTVAAIGLMIDPHDLGRTLGDGADGGLPAEKTGGRDLFAPTIFLYDHVPGGVGLAARIWEEKAELMRRARALVAACDCDVGCPGCVGPLPVDAAPEVLMGNRKHLGIAVLEVVGVPGS